MKKITFIILGVAILFGITFLIIQKRGKYGENNNPPPTTIPGTEGWNTYTSPNFKFTFLYPNTYFLEEKELGDGHRYHYQVMLTEDTEENRAVREGRAPGREGPVAITFDIFQNNLDKQGTLEWIQGNNNSNFKLSEGTYSVRKIGEASAIRYHWSGLYEADAWVFPHAENMIMTTVTYIAPEDQIKKDFELMLQTITLEKEVIEPL